MLSEEFNPDTAIDQYTTKKNQVQMILDRGYSPYNEYLNQDDSGYLTIPTDDMISYAYENISKGINPNSIFHGIYSNGRDRIAVFYLDAEKGKEDIPKQSIEPYVPGPKGKIAEEIILNPEWMIKTVIFIAPRKLGNKPREEVEALADQGIVVQIFTWLELLSLSPLHVYNGHSSLMSPEEEKEFIQGIKNNPKIPESLYTSSLPNFNITDPIVKYYGVRPGKLIITHSQVFTHDSFLRETTFIRKVI